METRVEIDECIGHVKQKQKKIETREISLRQRKEEENPYNSSKR